MKALLTKVWNWLIKSSANPAKVSLTIKAVVASTAIYVATASNLFGLPGLTSDSFKSTGSDLAQLVEWILIIISASTGAFGLIRKIVLSIKSWRG